MSTSSTYLGTVQVKVPPERATQAQLRLEAQLRGADLRPPGLAPSQVLLVKRLSDPLPGRLKIEGPTPIIDRRWERTVRDELAEFLHRAKRPEKGRIPSSAEAVLFADEAEAWACWSRARVLRPSTGPNSWWEQSLEGGISSPLYASESTVMKRVWSEKARFVPSMIASLVEWRIAGGVLRQLSDVDAGAILNDLCTEYNIPGPPEPSDGDDFEGEPSVLLRSPSDSDDDGSSRRNVFYQMEEGRTKRKQFPPWRSVVAGNVFSTVDRVLSERSPAHRELFGMALALHVDPVPVRSRSFQKAWTVWKRAQEEKSMTWRGGPKRRDEAESEQNESHRQEEDRSLPEDRPHYPSAKETEEIEGASQVQEREEGPPFMVNGEPSRGPYTLTRLGGVLYLVNVLTALNLPAVAKTPPVREYVGAWAILDAMARTLLGSDPDTLHPNDPLWRILAQFDGRPPEARAGRMLDEVLTREELSFETFRLPPSWVESALIEDPFNGKWAVAGGRLYLWAAFGCLANLSVTARPSVQAKEEWDRYPGGGTLSREESPDTMPLASEPIGCTPALSQWGAYVGSYVRYRLSLALDLAEREDDWVSDLFCIPGKLYVSDTHVDLILPMDAARMDVRFAGLDRSPGWWAPGGRVVRFHFQDDDEDF